MSMLSQAIVVYRASRTTRRSRAAITRMGGCVVGVDAVRVIGERVAEVRYPGQAGDAVNDECGEV